MESERWVYVTTPVDNWGGWRDVKGYLAALLANGEDDGVYPEDLARAAYLARQLVTSAGWEGDGFWSFSMLPNPDQCDSVPLFAVKQSNNGTCFFCSPFRLPYLRGESREEEQRVPVRGAAPTEEEKMAWFAAFGLEKAYSAYRQGQITLLPSGETTGDDDFDV